MQSTSLTGSHSADLPEPTADQIGTDCRSPAQGRVSRKSPSSRRAVSARASWRIKDAESQAVRTAAVISPARTGERSVEKAGFTSERESGVVVLGDELEATGIVTAGVRGSLPWVGVHPVSRTASNHGTIFRSRTIDVSPIASSMSMRCVAEISGVLSCTGARTRGDTAGVPCRAGHPTVVPPLPPLTMAARMATCPLAAPPPSKRRAARHR
jgi:hypothetical protein